MDAANLLSEKVIKSKKITTELKYPVIFSLSIHIAYGKILME